MSWFALLAYRNFVGYPALRTRVKYEPRDIPLFVLKGLTDMHGC